MLLFFSPTFSSFTKKVELLVHIFWKSLLINVSWITRPVRIKSWRKLFLSCSVWNYFTFISSLHLLSHWTNLNWSILNVFNSNWKISTWVSFSKTIPKKLSWWVRSQWTPLIMSKIGLTVLISSTLKVFNPWIGPKLWKLSWMIQRPFLRMEAGISWTLEVIFEIFWKYGMYLVSKIVLTYQIVLVIEKNLWNSRLKAQNLQRFWDHLSNLFKLWNVRIISGNRM